MGDKTINFFSKLLLMITLKSTIITGAMGYDYYWRDYDGVNIPSDALEVGKGSNSYIGQVYLYDCGILVGTIQKGKSSVEVSACDVVQYPSKNIKILCTDVSDNPPENMWLTTSSETFLVDTIEKNPVIGGFDGKYSGSVNIGRLSHGNSLIAGNINSYSTDNIRLWYAYGGQALDTTRFQVLVNPPTK